MVGPKAARGSLKANPIGGLRTRAVPVQDTSQDLLPGPLRGGYGEASVEPAGWAGAGVGVSGWPDFDPDFAVEPGLIEPYLSAILPWGH